MRSSHRLMQKKRISAADLHGEAFVAYAAHADDDGQLRLLQQLLGEEPRILHHAPNTVTVLTLAAAGTGLALVPASLETVNIPNIAYRPLADFSAHWELVLVSRRNEPSAAVQRFIEIARTPDAAERRSSVAAREAQRPRRRR
jgi:DNA-binding transcriptional LysR family regulator